MMRNISGIVMATLVALVTAAVTVGAQRATPSPTVQKTAGQAKQAANVTVVVDGKELVTGIGTIAEPLKNAGYSVSKEDGRIVIAGNTMSKELAALVQKARELMRDRPGRIEITQTDKSSGLNQIKEIYMSGSGQMDVLPGTYKGAPYLRLEPDLPLVGFRERLPLSAVPLFEGYAYTDQDRKHALELEQESFDIRQRYVLAKKGAERAQLESRLNTVLDELFDLKTKGYREKVKAIEAELEKLRARVEERQKNKELIVTGRFKELLGQENHLRW